MVFLCRQAKYKNSIEDDKFIINITEILEADLRVGPKKILSLNNQRDGGQGHFCLLQIFFRLEKERSALGPGSGGCEE